MIYRNFKDKKLSLLGFGTMRLPVLEGAADNIDEKQVAEMVKLAIDKGVNYFDTAYPYHDGMSEIVIGKALSEYPRDKFFLATKFPGHQIMTNYDPAEIFEDQLKKCRVDYFDFYLLHNVFEFSMHIYEDEQWGIMDYFLEQKKNGRIKHLGFSTHGMDDFIEKFLEKYGDEMEFCQIQLNYLDWTLQKAKEKVELLNKYNIPIWVMEPVRGGSLVNLDEKAMAKVKSSCPDYTPAQLAFRWLMGVPGVKMILSGMSNIDQMIDNINTFDNFGPTSEVENEFLLELAEDMKDALPCTSCRYCVEGCPKNLDIPKLIGLYNEMRLHPSVNVGLIVKSMPNEEHPSECIACGKCTKACPQKIDIPTAMSDFSEHIKKADTWDELSRHREEAAKRLREKNL